MYAEPGPVATFSLYMPVQAGLRQLQYQTEGLYEPVYDPEGPTLEFMTYEMTGGGTYEHLYDPAAVGNNFVWKEASVDFQLLGDKAPISVANFIRYVNEDAYDNTIVHRSEAMTSLVDSQIIQLGNFRISSDENYLLDAITRRPPIQWEESIPNAKGTIGMARAGLNTASSEFFINLDDNSDTLRNDFTVFAEVLEPETSLPLLDEMGDAYVWNLSLFLGDLFRTTPLYSPVSPWDVSNKSNYLRIKEISVPEGNRSGITYAWEFADADGVEGTSDEEAANQAVFDVQLNGGDLSVSRSDSGQAVLVITGTSGENSESFRLPLVGYNADALTAFPSSSIEQGGYIDNSWYGHMRAETYPFILHDNHGAQWVSWVINEALAYYIYDVKLHSWLYTTPGIYPTLYVFKWGTFVEYVEDTGNGMDIPRWFYNYTTEEWVTD